MIKILKEETRRKLGDGSLSKEERIDTFMEMGEIIAEELGLKLTGFDPTLSFRDENWNSTQISLHFAIPLVKKLIELRITRDAIKEIEEKIHG